MSSRLMLCLHVWDLSHSRPTESWDHQDCELCAGLLSMQVSEIIMIVVGCRWCNCGERISARSTPRLLSPWPTLPSTRTCSPTLIWRSGRRKSRQGTPPPPPPPPLFLLSDTRASVAAGTLAMAVPASCLKKIPDGCRAESWCCSIWPYEHVINLHQTNQ